MDAVNSILAAFVAVCTLIAGLSPLIVALLKKIKDDRIRKLAEDAVAFAEQVAKNHEKKTSEKMPSQEKLNLADQKLNELSPGIPENKAKLLIESVLGRISLRKESR